MTKVTRKISDRRSSGETYSDAQIAERTLPHSIEAEQAVLGAVLLHNDAYHTAGKHVRMVDFFREAHRRIYAALARMLDQPGGSVDMLTLTEELTRIGDLDECGGPSYIAKLIDGVPRSTNVGHYAAIVREKARLRECIYLSNKMLSAAYDAEDTATDIIAAADKAIIELRHGDRGGAMQSTKESASRLLDQLEWRIANRGKLTGVTSGFQSIDDMTGGWQPGDMIIIGARPSIGKTTLVLNMALAAARSGKRVAIFSLEMKRIQLEMRMLSSMSGIPLSTIMDGWVQESQFATVTHAVGELAELPIMIDDTARRSVWDVRGKCRELIADGGLDLLIIDYLQLIEGDGDKRYEIVTAISRDLKVMAGELSIPTIVLSQLSRASEGRPDPRPKSSDLRESGALEQDADIIAFLHRKHHREGGATELFIDKGRNIDGGSTYLTLHRELTKFEDGGEPPPPPTPAEKKAATPFSKIKAIRARQRQLSD